MIPLRMGLDSPPPVALPLGSRGEGKINLTKSIRNVVFEYEIVYLLRSA